MCGISPIESLDPEGPSILVTFCLSQEFDDETLLQKTPRTLVTGSREIGWALKAVSILAFITISECATQTSGGKGEVFKKSSKKLHVLGTAVVNGEIRYDQGAIAGSVMGIIARFLDGYKVSSSGGNMFRATKLPDQVLDVNLLL